MKQVVLMCRKEGRNKESNGSAQHAFEGKSNIAIIYRREIWWVRQPLSVAFGQKTRLGWEEHHCHLQDRRVLFAEMQQLSPGIFLFVQYHRKHFLQLLQCSICSYYGLSAEQAWSNASPLLSFDTEEQSQFPV